jgi:hypothetical protein
MLRVRNMNQKNIQSVQETIKSAKMHKKMSKKNPPKLLFLIAAAEHILQHGVTTQRYDRNPNVSLS